jgi:hypothetical protein
MKHPRRYVNCGPIVELKPVLEKWCDLNRDFYKELKDDCPWWYNERASISILAAAAWHAGALALEEFSTTKGRRRTGSERPGRCDLKIWMKRNQFAFEAKQKWCRLNTGNQGKDLANKCDDILAVFHMGRRIGLCFIAPRILAKGKNLLDHSLDKLLDLFEKKQHHDAIAWFFVEDPTVLEDKDTGLLYPGTVLLLKEVKK